MPIGTPLQLVTRLDAKFGEIDDALATKASAPLNGGAFNPNQIDLSLGAVEYDFYQQTGLITFALDPTKTPVIGGSVSVNIRGGGPNPAVTFPSTFVGLEGLTSGTILTSGQSYPFYIRFAPDWDGVGQHRILIGALGLTTPSGQLVATEIKAFPGPHFSAVGEAVRTNTAGGSFDLAMPVGAAEGAIVGIEDHSPTSWSTSNHVRLHTTDGAGFIREDTGAIQPGAIPEGVILDGGNSALWRKTAGQWKFIGQTGLMSGGGGGGGAVSSVFGRTAAVIAQSGDYTVAQVTGAAPVADPTFTGTVNLPANTVQTGNIAAGAVALSKIQNLTAARLLGRTDASTGAPQEITLSGALTLSGTTLSAAAGVPTSRQILTPNSVRSGTTPTATSDDLVDNITLSLHNDVAVPGNNQVYGTSGSGVRGWQNLPAGSLPAFGGADRYLRTNATNNAAIWVDLGRRRFHRNDALRRRAYR